MSALDHLAGPAGILAEEHIARVIDSDRALVPRCPSAGGAPASALGALVALGYTQAVSIELLIDKSPLVQIRRWISDPATCAFRLPL